MKLFLFILATLLNFQTFAQTENKICSNTTDVCTYYASEIGFSTKQEGRFKLFIESATSEINLVKVDLWMQMGHHGHGSSPLKVVALSPNEFDVTKAYFVMKGQWQIRVKYRVDSLEETLIIPVMIKE